MDPTSAPLGGRFWRLWTASGLSNLADGVFKTVLPLAAVATTRDPLLIGGLTTAATLPWLLLSLPAGALVDRHDRRRLMLGANAVRALVLAAGAALVVGLVPPIWLLYVVAVVAGVAEVLHDTASQSILPQVVGRPVLSRANGRIFAVELTANEFVGPPLGGWLFSVAVAVAFGVPALAWGLGLVMLLSVRGRFRVAREGPPSSVRADVVEGLGFVVRHPVLRTLSVMTGVFNLASSAVGAVLVLYAVGPGSAMGLTAGQFGVLLTATAAGSVLGTFLAAPVERVLGARRTLGAGLVLGVAFLGVCAFSAESWVVAAAFVVGGVGLMLWNVVAVAIRQAVTPDAMLGRATGAHRLVAWGSRPLGGLLGGLLAQAFGLQAVFVSMSVLVLLTLPLTRVLARPGQEDRTQ